MVFSLILLAPSWGGMINGIMTLSGAWHKLRDDPILRFLIVSLSFYGMSTFEGPMMSIKTVNALSHYTDWTVGHVHSGALGWVGLISMGSDAGTAARYLPTDTIHDNLAPNAGANHYGIPNDIASLGHVSNWRSHFLNIVTETFYDINKTGFVSEKIYKPIVGCRPFLVYDPDGACRWLQNRGFETYVNDFADISDLDLTIPGNMAPFLDTLCGQSVTYYQKKFVDLKEKILYNKEHFRHHVDLQNRTVQQGITCPI
jgi:hypothetical protein